MSLKKYIIAIIDSNNDIILKEETLTNEINEIEFADLINFLDSKVFKIEKKFNQFIKNIYLIIDHTDSMQSECFLQAFSWSRRVLQRIEENRNIFRD